MNSTKTSWMPKPSIICWSMTSCHCITSMGGRTIRKTGSSISRKKKAIPRWACKNRCCTAHPGRKAVTVMIVDKIKCPYCGYVMPLKVDPDAKCKGVWIKCKGRNCKKEFEIKIGKVK